MAYTWTNTRPRVHHADPVTLLLIPLLGAGGELDRKGTDVDRTLGFLVDCGLDALPGERGLYASSAPGTVRFSSRETQMAYTWTNTRPRVHHADPVTNGFSASGAAETKTWDGRRAGDEP
jgi:hypothetical protein